MNLPPYIALCGNPNAGKSTVQQILQTRYFVRPVDDGGPLRDITQRYLGLSHDQVHTQDGKKEMVEILGRTWQVREILGELGHHLELMFGEHIMPFMVTNSLHAPDGPYSFGSVRKSQGWFYKKLGGIVVEVRRPGAGPSQYAFDQFDAHAVDYVIVNNGSIADLEREVADMVAMFADRKAAE